MKKRLLSLLVTSVLVLFGTSAFAQVPDTIFIDLRNPTTIPGSPAQLQFDVYVRGNVAGTYFGSIITFMQFDQAVMGTNPNIAISKLGLFSGASGPAYTAVINKSGNIFNTTVDNGFNFFFSPPSNFIELPTTFQPFVRVTMDYPTSNAAATDILLLRDDSPPTPYDNGTYKVIGGTSPTGEAYEFAYENSTVSFGPAPVEWLDFTAQRLDDARIQLKWITASETNNDFFVVQRSVDGELFENIGTVEGAGTTREESEYQFFDTNYPTSRLFYRIKQVDVSGQSSFSSVASVLIGEGESKVAFFLYPSPAVDVVNAELLGETVDTYHLIIVDQMGRTVFDSDMNQDNARLRIPVKDLADGIYNYQLTRGLDIVKQGRFMKVEK